MTRRSLFALLLAPLAKYLPKKAAPPAGAFTLAALDKAFNRAWMGPPVEVSTIWFSSGEVYRSYGEAWEKISQPVYWHGECPFMTFDLKKEYPWPTPLSTTAKSE